MKMIVEKNNKTEKKRISKMRNYFFSLVFLFVILIIIVINLPIFRINKVIVKNNNIVNSKYIQSVVENVYGTNIFFASKSKIQDKIIEQPEISNVVVEKRFPNTIVLDIEERKHIFYVEVDSKYFLIDQSGFVFQKKDSLKSSDVILSDVILLEGVEVNGLEINSYVSDDIRKVKLINELTNLFVCLNADVSKPDIVNIKYPTDIKMYYNNMCIIIGNSENLKDKINKGINVLNHENLFDKRGYIDVSYAGNPVFKIEE